MANGINLFWTRGEKCRLVCKEPFLRRKWANNWVHVGLWLVEQFSAYMTCVPLLNNMILTHMESSYGIRSYLSPWYVVLKSFWESLRPTISCRSISMTFSCVSHLDSRLLIIFSCRSHLPFRVCTSIMRAWTVSSSLHWASGISSEVSINSPSIPIWFSPSFVSLGQFYESGGIGFPVSSTSSAEGVGVFLGHISSACCPLVRAPGLALFGKPVIADFPLTLSCSLAALRPRVFGGPPNTCQNYHHRQSSRSNSSSYIFIFFDLHGIDSRFCIITNGFPVYCRSGKMHFGNSYLSPLW